MPKVKYYYDSDTLSYKKIKTTKRTVLKYVSVYLLGSALFGFLFILVASKYFESPKEKSLTRELQNLQIQFEVLNKKIDNAEIVLSNIIYLYLIFISATIAFWLDGVFIGSLKVKLLRNIMIISGILFFSLEMVLLQENNDNLWISFLVFFTARSMLLAIALYYHIKNNRFIMI